jgi:hypothetical protein
MKVNDTDNAGDRDLNFKQQSRRNRKFRFRKIAADNEASARVASAINAQTNANNNAAALQNGQMMQQNTTLQQMQQQQFNQGVINQGSR